MAANENAAVLSKKQQRSTLNAKKKVTEKSLRNVITLPYEKYWPLVKNGDDTTLLALLQTHLQKLRLNYERIPISSLQGKSTQEKKQIKTDVKNRKESSEEFKEAVRLRSMLLLGVNAVSRGLEGGVAGAVLVCGDADPQLMVHHLVQLAGMTRVPTLVLNSLRTTCTSAMGFTCVALGIRSCAAEDSTNEFHEMYQEILRLSSKCPIPESLTILSIPDPVEPQTQSSSEHIKEKPIKTEQPSAQNWHLRRPKGKLRAFIPGCQANVKLAEDFISIGGDVDEEMPSSDTEPLTGISRQTASSYRPLLVKRVRPNPNKMRKSKKPK